MSTPALRGTLLFVTMTMNGPEPRERIESMQDKMGKNEQQVDVDIHDRILDAYYGRMGETMMRSTQKRIHWICGEVVGKKVLDVGCSQGIVPLLLAREGFEVLGIDLDEQAISVAREQLGKEHVDTQKNMSLLCANFMLHDLGKEKYDTVVMSEVLEHLTRPEEFLRRARELAINGGRLVVTVPFGVNDFIDHKKTYYLASAYALLSEFAEIDKVVNFGHWIGFSCSFHERSESQKPKSIPLNFALASEDSVEQIEREYRNSLDGIKKKLSDSNASYKRVSLEKEGLTSRVNDIEKTRDGLKSEISHLIDANDKLTHQKKYLSEEIDQKNHEIAGQKARLDRYIREKREAGQGSGVLEPRLQAARELMAGMHKQLENVAVRYEQMDLQLEELQRSARYRLGSMIVGLARRPWSIFNVLGEVRHLYGEWRDYRTKGGRPIVALSPPAQALLKQVKELNARAAAELKQSQAMLPDTPLMDVSQWGSDGDGLARWEWCGRSARGGDQLLDNDKDDACWLDIELAGRALSCQLGGRHCAEVVFAFDVSGIQGELEIEAIVYGPRAGEGASDMIMDESIMVARQYRDHGRLLVRVFPLIGTSRVDVVLRSERGAKVRNACSCKRLYQGISVVVPTYMGEKTIRDMLNSLAAQTLDRDKFEVVIVRNGPQGSTPGIIEEFCERHADLNIRCFDAEKCGAGHARNIGIDRSEYAQIAFLDDDDWLGEDYLSGLLSVSGPTTIGIARLCDVVNGVRKESHVDKAICHVRENKTPPLKDLQSVMCMSAVKAIPSAWVKQVAFDEDLRSGEDVHYFSSLIAQFEIGYKFAKDVGDIFYYRRIRGNSISRQDASVDFSIRQRMDVIKLIEGMDNEWLDSEKHLYLHQIMRSQIQFAVRYIREYPEAYAKFNEEIRSHQLQDAESVHWANGLLADTLVVSYCFAPDVDTAGVVAAKRIREYGRPVDVVSNNMGTRRIKDDRLRLLCSDLVGHAIAINAPVSFRNWPLVKQFVDGVLVEAKQLSKRRGRDYSHLYSRVMWPASHFAAAAYKAEHPSVHWRAEFSDPILMDIEGNRRQGDIDETWVNSLGVRRVARRLGVKLPKRGGFFFWCEYLPYLLADELVFTNKLQLEYMLSYVTNARVKQLVREKAIIKPHPTLGKEYYDLAKPDICCDPACFNIAYFGSFYKNRGLGDVLDAINRLRAEPGIMNIRLYVYTSQGEEIRQHKDYEGIRDFVIIRDLVGYLEFLSLLRQFDCLVVTDTVTAGQKIVNPYLPSKASDYMGSGRPVWAIVEPRSSLCELALRDERISCVTTLGDIAAHCDVLRAGMAQGAKGLKEERIIRVPACQASAESAGAELLSRSLTFQLGSAMQDAGRSPGGAIRLPIRLYRLAREGMRRRAECVAEDVTQWRVVVPVRIPNALPSAAVMGGGRPRERRKPETVEYSSKSAATHAVPQLPEDIKSVRIACIMDEFTHSSFSPCCLVESLTPDNGVRQLERFQPHLLFVESAWQGLHGEWDGKITKFLPEFLAILEWCRKNRVPTVFWNKEDPVHFETFLRVASEFDYVFTTDIDRIASYKSALGHDRVYLLPFACQPKVHNPISQYERKSGFCFAGSYYEKYKERKRDFAEIVDGLRELGPFDIYDRNHGKDIPGRRFPMKYAGLVKGVLPFAEIDRAYKGYAFGVNLNTVKQSQTMFARRAFELLACNTPSISNYARGLVLFLGDLVVCSDNGKELSKRVSPYVGEEHETRYNKFRLAGLRKVLSEHTYEDRLAYVMKMVHGVVYEKKLPFVNVVATVRSDDDLSRVKVAFDRQCYGKKQLTLVLSGDFSPGVELSGSNVTARTESDLASCLASETWKDSFVALFDPADYYGDHYLYDLVLATLYTSSANIGKGSYYSSVDGVAVLNDGGRQYRNSEALPPRRSMTLASAIGTDVLEWCHDRDKNIADIDAGFSVDEFNYLRDATQDAISTVTDLSIADTGVSLPSLLAAAGRVSHEDGPAPEETPCYSASDIFKLYQRSAGEGRVNLDFDKGAGTLWVRSDLPRGQHAYLYQKEHLPLQGWQHDGMIKLYLDVGAGMFVQPVLVFFDGEGERVGSSIKYSGLNLTIPVPEGAVSVHMALRIQGAGVVDVRRIVFGHIAQRANTRIPVAPVLLIADAYPSYASPDRSRALHERIKAYRSEGLRVEVFCLDEDVGKQIRYREFEGIDVASGSEDALRESLQGEGHECILVDSHSESAWRQVNALTDDVPIVTWSSTDAAGSWDMVGPEASGTGDGGPSLGGTLPEAGYSNLHVICPTDFVRRFARAGETGSASGGQEASVSRFVDMLGQLGNLHAIGPDGADACQQEAKLISALMQKK